MAQDISRRQALQTAGAGALLLAMGDRLARPARAHPGSSPARVCRLAHMSDMHIQPERRAGEGMAAAFRHVGTLADKPQLIITGGDTIMDSMDADRARTQQQWDLWHRVVKDESPLPIRSCIGNHDVWGWNKGKSKTTGSEEKWGKGWATDALKLDERYIAFDLPKAGGTRGWRCIILDSVFPSGDGYIARLDEPQMDWLERTLRDHAQARPDDYILIVSHIPILSACVFFDTKPGSPRNKEVSPSLMHEDCAALKALFARYPQVRACLSGHIHQLDRVEFNNVTYLCNGAVSGAWWKGRHVDCDEGYAVIDLFDDGTIRREYATYGWKAEA